LALEPELLKGVQVLRLAQQLRVPAPGDPDLARRVDARTFYLAKWHRIEILKWPYIFRQIIIYSRQLASDYETPNLAWTT